jgi:hypothetical protein
MVAEHRWVPAAWRRRALTEKENGDGACMGAASPEVVHVEVVVWRGSIGAAVGWWAGLMTVITHMFMRGCGVARQHMAVGWLELLIEQC